MNNRVRVHDALNSNNIATNTIDLLGCSKEFFYNFIKWQLPYDMIDNEFKKRYNVDHVRHIATFNLSDPASQFDAFHWINT